MTDVRMWRVPASTVKRGGAYSVIQDNGMLTAAHVASNGNWLFSEVGAGVKPLALIGRMADVNAWFVQHRHKGIENRIADLPDIHMGMCYYIPGNRYKGLFPMHDAIQAVTEGSLGIAGGFVPSAGGLTSAVSSMGGATADSVSLFRQIFGRKKPKPPKMSPSSHDVYIKFSYLPEKNMSKIGSGTVTLDAIGDFVKAGFERM